MQEKIMQMISTLEDKEAGWVKRRDAAEALGKAANQCIAALLRHIADQDMDVKMAVDRCIEPLTLMLQSRGQGKKHYTLRDLAFSCERTGARAVEAHESGFVVTVKLNQERSHKVYIMPHESRDGRVLVRIYTLCGEATPERLSWTLKANTKLTHGAFALLSWNEVEHLVIINNIIRTEATPEMVKRSVKEMAHYGDWLEQKISGLDEF